MDRKNLPGLSYTCQNVVIELWANGFTSLTLLDMNTLKSHVLVCSTCRDRINSYIKLNDPNQEIELLKEVK